MAHKKIVLLCMALFTVTVAFSGCKKSGEAPWINVESSEARNIIIEKEIASEEEGQEETEGDVEYSSVSPSQTEIQLEETYIEPEEASEDKFIRNSDGKIIVDLVMFMGQSNMAGTGGDAKEAPKVLEDQGYEFRAISDPTRLYPIEEPFGAYENNLNAIYDMPGSKKGSLVSAFANEYYAQTGVPIVAVSAAQGGTDTAFWMKSNIVADFSERQKRAQVWLESNNYCIRKQYVIWLQGESDALDEVTTEQYKQNMDNIIRPLFIGGVQKVFIITPGRTIEQKEFFNSIIKAQLELCKDSGYYALATTDLCGVSTEYMIDSFHYNQSVLNYIGRDAARSAAYYTNNTKEMCLYDYKNNTTFIPDGYDYPENTVVEKIDINESGELERYE